MKNFFSNKETKRILNTLRVDEKFRVVAKEITGNDVEYMYDDLSKMPGVCPYCRSKYKSIPNLEYKPNKRKADTYCTYDDFFIVSDKFKTFCELNGYKDLLFVKLHKSRYYFFEPQSVFKTNIYWHPFNELGHWCDMCKDYCEITGGVLKDESFELDSDDFILKTDRCYGSFEWKSPSIIVGLKTMEKMKAFGLKGIYFCDVWG